MPTLAELHDRLESDPIRDEIGFDADFETIQKRLLVATSDTAREELLGSWLGKYQPCLFGKLAAKRGLLGYSFLTERTIMDGDDAVRAHIRADKLQWRRDAARGRKSGFVVLAISERLATARPDAALRSFAQRLAELYFNIEEAPLDSILLDFAALEVPGRDGPYVISWHAGVNVFAAAGDGRWWQDHRIPAGLAFSVNSVGHMVGSAEVANALTQFNETLKLVASLEDVGKVESLDDALRMAMLTIENASVTVSGKATWLLPEGSVEQAKCPKTSVTLPSKLVGKAACKYHGSYHTDHTIPSSYFRSDVTMPADIRPIELDFSYLYHDSVTNPAYQTMGLGEQIRGDQPITRLTETVRKGFRQWGVRTRIEDLPELQEALAAE
jgi:hypothetical protein